MNTIFHSNHTGSRVDADHGFTIVELIVTVVVATIFLTLFFQAFMVLESQRVTVARQAKAYDIAYSNLQKVATRTGLTSAACCPTNCDLTSRGYDLYVAADLQKELGSDAGQSLIAYPTNGCSGTNFDDNPIRIESKVWFTVYGTRSEAVYASYVQ